MRLQPPALVLFDIAGTLIGDTGLTMGSYEAVLTQEKMPFDPAWLRERIGCRKESVFLELLQVSGCELDSAHELASRFAAHINSSIERNPPPVLPGVLETFSMLHANGCAVGLVTGFNVSTARRLRDAAGWTPDVIVGSDEVPAGRPAPDLVHEAMRRAQVEDVGRVACVGDTPRDLCMGEAAGCRWNVGVATGSYTLKELGGHPHTALIASMNELCGELGLG